MVKRMAVPLRQSAKVGAYIVRQRLRRREKYALVLELEPLFQCNLACAGCGKIQHPDHILRRRMPVEQARRRGRGVRRARWSRSPGGEPLVHPEIDEIAGELIKRKKFVYLCTNALLMEKKLDRFEPSPYFAWAVHMDGLRERHDQSVCRDGVFDKAVGGDPGGQGPRASASPPTRRSSPTTRPRPCARCSTSSTTTSRSTR